ncbi:hypothetical protein [Priestia megaterium]|uniref:hypothetical protein n=1 Tax=Priestia megaterium TaxID=1404 RepID=UPI003CC5F603
MSLINMENIEYIRITGHDENGNEIHSEPKKIKGLSLIGIYAFAKHPKYVKHESTIKNIFNQMGVKY